MEEFPTFELACQYVEALKRHFGGRMISVMLHGSVARGDYTTASDIDLLILAEGLPESRRERNRILSD